MNNEQPPQVMYQTDDLLRKHHLLIEDCEGGSVRLVDWQSYEPVHPDQALEYRAELKHGSPGFPWEELAARLLEWVASLRLPAEPYVRKELPPNMCFACSGADHDVCGCEGHYDMIDRMRRYLGKDEDEAQ